MPSILNSDDGVVSGTSGLKSTGGNDGLLNIQSNGSTVVAMTGSGVSVTGTLTASGATTLSGAVSASSLSVNSNNISADNSLGFRNRIINGDMRIDQRVSGTVTLDTNSRFIVDRFFAEDDSSATVTGVQSTTAPNGFVNSMLFTVTTADASITSSENCNLRHWIEGLNVADLGWGTANAKTVTLSFWVRSSVTGTHSGALLNSAANRNYVFSYTISSANTWEYKTITIAGDTSGTWLTTNGRGIGLFWNLGAGSTFLGTAGSWGSSVLFGATGSIQLISTLNATWYITGVQLEVGSTATPFERRPYGTELMLCQRYYQTIYNLMACAAGTTQIQSSCQFPVPMRAAPTIGQGGSGTGLKFTDGTSDFNPTSFSFTNQNTTSQGFFGLFPNYSSLTSRSALSLASDGGRWVTLSIEL